MWRQEIEQSLGTFSSTIFAILAQPLLRLVQAAEGDEVVGQVGEGVGLDVGLARTPASGGLQGALVPLDGPLEVLQVAVDPAERVQHPPLEEVLAEALAGGDDLVQQRQRPLVLALATQGERLKKGEVEMDEYIGHGRAGVAIAIEERERVVEAAASRSGRRRRLWQDCSASA